MDIISVLSCIFFFFHFFFPLFFSTEITKRLKVSQFALKSPSRLLDRVIDLTRIVLLSLYNNCYELSTRLDKIPIAITRIKEPSLLLRVLNLNVRCAHSNFHIPLLQRRYTKNSHVSRKRRTNPCPSFFAPERRDKRSRSDKIIRKIRVSHHSHRSFGHLPV